jgi:hypothetical protein
VGCRRDGVVAESEARVEGVAIQEEGGGSNEVRVGLEVERNRWKGTDRQQGMLRKAESGVRAARIGTHG